MWYIKEILKASVCSFCETVYEYQSLNISEFLEGVRNFLREEDLEDCLATCSENITYDIKNIDNICDDIMYLLNKKKFEFNDISKCCEKAFRKTLYVDNTINVEAFVDNITTELNKK